MQLLDVTSGTLVDQWITSSSATAEEWMWQTFDEEVTGLDASHAYAIRLHAYDAWNQQRVRCRWEYVLVSRLP